MAKIKIVEGTWNDECTTELNLTNAHALFPDKGYDKVIMYAEKRHLMTFLTAGATNGAFTVARTTKAYKTRIPMVPTGELIDGKAWKYHIMGRIQRSCEILGTAAIGTPTAATTSVGGYFTLKLKDNYLQPDMVALFYNRKMARVQGQPRKGPGYYIYNFQCFPGDTFSWDTWVGPQLGTKTLFGGYTSHGERSLRGYGRTHYPDAYINHMTIQRKGAAITGDANAEKVLWYVLEGEDSKGWIYWIEAQSRAQFLLEDEFNKWNGRSTMKDSEGNLLSTPSMIDPETGMPIVSGDGLIPQIEGANDIEASGTNGEAVWDDFSDLVREVMKHSNSEGGQIFYCVTGQDGLDNIHTQALAYGKASLNLTQMITQDGSIGGASPAIGFNFQALNIQGNTVYFVVNPALDDDEKYPRRLTGSGKLASSMTYYLVDASRNDTGRPNIEIRTRGRRGVNRNLVYFYLNGMTGEGTPQTAVDGKEFQLLKENMMVIYNTKSCGIISPPATA